MQEILSTNKNNTVVIKEEPTIQQTQIVKNHTPTNSSANSNVNLYNVQPNIYQQHVPNSHLSTTTRFQVLPSSPNWPINFIKPGLDELQTNPFYFDPSFYIRNPPPVVQHSLTNFHAPMYNTTIPQTSSYIYQQLHSFSPQLQLHGNLYQPYNPYNQSVASNFPINQNFQSNQILHNNMETLIRNKRKFSELNTNNNDSSIINNKSSLNSYNNNNNNVQNTIFCQNNSHLSNRQSLNIISDNFEYNKSEQSTAENKSQNASYFKNNSNANEEEDLNIMRERELKELKCKSIVEKMSVFLKYYQQFKESYIQRVQTIECSDSLKVQFHSLIKYLNEYESLLAELNSMIMEHERTQCKNNHRKTKKYFNKTKAFIRYECNKRLQSNIFEYRRLINSQDRYAGMYDLLDMNSHLISLLPDIGISIRRYINRCEKAREQEKDEEEYTAWFSENSNDSFQETNDAKDSSLNDVNNMSIPSFKEFIAQNESKDDDENENRINLVSEKENSNGENINDNNNSETFTERKDNNYFYRNYESFSKGIDNLNRYLLKRVEEEESLDELVKERIIKWINKRQSKYILIFSEVDKLLNQHKAGECYPKFHSYLLFNLGKLVTVCDSYHQKLKELLYSTTIKRKKKRKKVKLLPEAMSDVFNEIIDLKKSLEQNKYLIKRCNEHKGSNGPKPV